MAPGSITGSSDADYAPSSHFFIKLFLAAPDSFLPSALTALVEQVSTLHFFRNEVLAAPASAFPSLLTAFVSQDSCAKAEPAAKVATMATRKIRFIGLLPINPVRGLEPGMVGRSSRTPPCPGGDIQRAGSSSPLAEDSMLRLRSRA